MQIVGIGLLYQLAGDGGVIALANPNTLTGTTLDTAWLTSTYPQMVMPWSPCWMAHGDHPSILIAFRLRRTLDIRS